jgi:hypothetical protein
MTMSSYDSLPTGRDSLTGTDDPDMIKADIERTRAELAQDVDALTGKADPRQRARQALGTAKGKAAAAASRARTAGPQKARRAAQVARDNSKPTGAAVLLVLAAVATTVLARRRAAKARAAQTRWSRFRGR